MDLLLKKSNQQFDEFCNALHATEQTHVVKNKLITQGMYILSEAHDYIYDFRDGSGCKIFE